MVHQVSESISRNFIEWVEFYAKQTPGAGAYETDKALKSLHSPSGGKFNESNAKSSLDWEIYRASQLPVLPAPDQCIIVPLLHKFI
jgi:hypothetical protein